MTMLRLDKYLADMGVGTRSEVKKMIRSGQVFLNGEAVKKPETKVDTEQDEVEADGQTVGYATVEYIMLNKPQGVVSATQDKRDKTVLDLIEDNMRKDLFPVGRLDKDTEGLLILTNDGKMAHELLSPKKHIDKTYFVIVEGMVTEEDVKLFRQGFHVDAELDAKPSVLEILESGEFSKVNLTITEGKFHQVKRMFQAIEKPVRFLKRIRMGALCLDERLKPGEYRMLTEEEIDLLKKGKV